MLGGALEARRGRGEHTAEGARRLSGKGQAWTALLQIGQVATGRCAHLVRGLVYGVVGTKNAAAGQSQRFIRRSWHNVCVTHCLSAQEVVSGGEKSKNWDLARER